MKNVNLPSFEQGRSHKYKKMDSDNDETQNSTKPSRLKRLLSKALRKFTLKTTSKDKTSELFTSLLEQAPHSDDERIHVAGSESISNKP